MMNDRWGQYRFCWAVRGLLAESGRTDEDLAKILGVHHTTLGRWLMRPKPEQAEQIAAALETLKR